MKSRVLGGGEINGLSVNGSLPHSTVVPNQTLEEAIVAWLLCYKTKNSNYLQRWYNLCTPLFTSDGGIAINAGNYRFRWGQLTRRQRRCWGLFHGNPVSIGSHFLLIALGLLAQTNTRITRHFQTESRPNSTMKCELHPLHPADDNCRHPLLWTNLWLTLTILSAA